ncbi:hypothetical protein [Scytonema sp. PCC 10023]|uniref:hypothetical protein n=1 Tax=Scytonema sp. PCC 10023 TaxID=1680591 RepID=UPI0039C69692
MSTGKGKKRIRNVPILYDEVKKRHGILLTDTAWASLVSAAKKNNVSVSELIEVWARNCDAE